MGSDSDLPVMTESARMLDKFGIPFEIEVVSAHRSPARTHEYATTAISRGLKTIIVAAGGAAHLAGVVALGTILSYSFFITKHMKVKLRSGELTGTLPVIAVPMATTVLAGIDSLLSTVQMPAGVPVAAMAIDKPGATNAAIYAAEILATSDPKVAERLVAYKQELAKSVAEKSERVKQQFAGNKS